MTGPSGFLRRPFSGLARAPGGNPNAPQLFADRSLAAFAEDSGASFAGELRIDNRAELARLLGLGEATPSDDAALMLKSFLRWGIDCLAKIEGDFAIAIWDARERRLLLARDSSGQRPLHYRRLGEGIAFASLPLGLAALAGAPRADLAQLACYLSGMPAFADRSFVEGVNRVRPGHVVVVEADGKMREDAWWRPDLTLLAISHEEALAEGSAQLQRTLRAMVRTRAPVIGADLSGGLDSSLVVACAADVLDHRERLLALTGVAGGPVDAPPRLFADETERAAETARINGVRYRVVTAPPESPLDALDRWLPSTQEPLGNACNLGWIDACYGAAAGAGAEVYLTGGRGNFTVSRPAMGRLPSLAGSGCFRSLGRELVAYKRFAGGTWPGLLASSFGPFLPDAVWNALVPGVHRRASNDSSATDALLRDSEPVRAAFEHGRAIARMDRMAADESPSARFQAIRSVDEGNGNLAVRRRHGMEMREPLSDRRFVELCIRLPAEHYFRDGKPRAFARDLLRGRAPASVVDEQHRGWQGANWRAGFESARPQMAAEVKRIADDPPLAAMMDTDRMTALLDAWPSGNWNDWGQIETYRNVLFRAIGAARFARFVREWPSA